MNYVECSNKEEYWTVRIRAFPKEKRKAVERLADNQRLSIGSYVGNLLDEQIQNAEKKEALDER